MRQCLLTVLFLFLAGGLATAQGRADFDPAPLLRDAAALLQQGQVLESAEAYEQVQELSTDPEIRTLALVRQAGIAALYLATPKAALRLYEEAIAMAPPGALHATALYNAAMLQYEMGRFSNAAEGFATYLASYPKGPRRQSAHYMLERSRRESDGAAMPSAKRVAPFQVTAKEPVVRVLLEKAASVVIQSPQGMHVLLKGGGYETLAAEEFVFTIHEGRVVISGREFGSSVVLLPEGGGFFWKGKRYPGEVAVTVVDQELALINRLPLETYLWGVIPAEMPASFAPQALAAQAVASRSYAAALLLGKQGEQWDLTASKLSQVYKGVRTGAPRIREAVESTSGEMLLHEGSPLLSYFHSHSGGMLEDDAAVWNGDLPFYKVQADQVSNNAKDMSWTLDVGWDELAKALRKQGLQAGQIHGLEVVERTGSGRLGAVRVLQDSGNITISGTLLRRALGSVRMRSTLCELHPRNGGVVFTGKGFGHGVGMSQWGAQGMAKAGSDYRAILAHYYPGVAIQRRY